MKRAMRTASTSKRMKARASSLENGCHKNLVFDGLEDCSTSALKVPDTGVTLPLNFDEAWRMKNSGLSRANEIDVIDLFCGCGGVSAGFIAANGAGTNFRLVGAADIDKDAAATYEKNLGVKPALADVAALADCAAARRSFVQATARNPDNPLVLIGCAPCQGFSSHRNNFWVADERNSLLVAFTRLAAELSPDAVVIENVPELLTDRYWNYVVAVRHNLERAGYYVHVGFHDTAGFGVPQNRFRALILAMKSPFAPPVPFLDGNNFRTVRDAIGSLEPLAAGARDPRDAMHYTVKHKQSTIETIKQVPVDGGSLPIGFGPECLRRAHLKSGKRVYEDIYGRLAWDKPAITITAHGRNPASGRFVHPEQHRGLSVREAALLQGFPSDYHFVGSLDSCFRQIGNAVPPAFAAFLACYISNQLHAAPSTEFQPGLTQPVAASFSRIIPSLKSAQRRQKIAGLASVPINV